MFPGRPVSAEPTKRAAELDALFARLAAAGSEEEGRRIEQQIWLHWTHHPDPQIDALMQQVLADRRVAAFDRALARNDQIIALDPDYAEAYNQRATIAFRRGEDFASLTAIAEALEREPRHFGALAGRAIIRLRQGKPALAIQSLLTATEVHPFLRERHLLDQLGYRPQEPR
jgi:tetratricopeptide (TPR) repeat protein